MNKTRILLRIFFTTVLFFTASTIFAQNGVIKGKIVDAQTKETVIGASVVIKGTSTGAAADLDGNFVIHNAPAGTHTIVVSSVGYQSLTKNEVVVQNNKETVINLLLDPEDLMLGAVEVVARVNRESEAVLLLEQRQALVATQSVGVRELSRKGIGDAQAAVAQVSGVSRQEGVKNVFVRGLGDRYNTTLLNGFPIPSEDPEYKNIALDFFGTDVIQNIGVSKVFSAHDYADVGGAIIDISSKQLVGNYALGLDLSGGINTAAIGTTDFLRQDGSNYFGFANTQYPAGNQFDFTNSLDPSVVSLPANHSFGIYGGKSFNIGEKANPLSFFVVASHSTGYSFTEEILRNMNDAGIMWQNQTGKTYSQTTSQLVLANVLYNINRKHDLQYNFMLVHANDRYVGEYSGIDNVFKDAYDEKTGITRRQQTNDNLLLVNQLISGWELTKRLKFDAGVSYNTVKGLEPDRRENNFSYQGDGLYRLTGSNQQARYFSELISNDMNVKTGLTYKLFDRYGSNNSSLKIGYAGRFVSNGFESAKYTFGPFNTEFNMEGLKLDDLYNRENLTAQKFTMSRGNDAYSVTKYINSGYAGVSYQVLEKLSGSIGLKMDVVNLAVEYDVRGIPDGTAEINKNYFLPGLNLKYDVNGKNSFRFGASKTYTLPQSKEIAPYQYSDISFDSQGYQDLKPSDNYNLDLKWDYYISPNELLSVNGFYKYIKNPIGRVEIASAGGYLSYRNISDFATVCGVEVELRKNLFGRFDTERELTKKLSLGINASYIYTDLEFDTGSNAQPKNTGLEGASPFLANADVSYNYTKQDKNFMASLVFSYFSDRIYTIGIGNYNDIMEEGVPALDFTMSYKFNRHLAIKTKAANILNQSYRLTRESSTGEKITLNEYKKGQDISLGISYEF